MFSRMRPSKSSLEIDIMNWVNWWTRLRRICLGLLNLQSKLFHYNWKYSILISIPSGIRFMSPIMSLKIFSKTMKVSIRLWLPTWMLQSHKEIWPTSVKLLYTLETVVLRMSSFIGPILLINGLLLRIINWVRAELKSWQFQENTLWNISE